ncbi:MAG TPA: hypothetical protein VH088_08715 [Terriglobales bacterium]|jgi:hypothetical protein|nr:hypothetical protein [Terriglobales bacterium]
MVSPDTPSHTPGTHRAEDWVKHQKEPGREGVGRTARDATGINPAQRSPIDPRMPDMPPA